MIKWLAVFTGLCISSLTAANNEFKTFFDSFDTLSANFVQQAYSDTGAPLAKTSGYLHFKRPAQFVWQTQAPITQTLLLSNNELWLIDKELEQASMRPIEQLKNTPLYWLINKPGQLENLPKFEHNELAINWYKTQQDDQLSFGFALSQLVAIKLNNPLGQKILVTLTDLKINPVFSQDTFELKLGADFDVIR